MITLYLISSISLSFMFACDIFILAHPHISKKNYLIFLLSSSALCFLHSFLDFSPMIFVFLVVNSFLIMRFTKKPYAVFYMPLSYIVNCVLLNLIGLGMNLLWGLSVQDMNSDKLLLVAIPACTAAASCPVLYLARRLIQDHLISTFESMDKKLLGSIALTLFLCAFLIYTLASFFDHLEITHREYFLMASSVALYSLFTISMVLIVLRTAKKNYETQKKVEYLENLNEYTKNLELLYNNLRSFKHDYSNIMASLAAYIDEKKYEELEAFFYGHILPMQKNLTQKNGTLNNLSHIKPLELKSILYAKLLLAANQDIEVTIDIPDEIDSIHMEPVDLTRMLGIYLDNAMEACLETEQPTINFHLGKMNQDTVFILSNTFVDKGLSVAQMYKKGVTTKGGGHGIGLHNVSEILNRYDNIYHETQIKDGLFIQQLQIS